MNSTKSKPSLQPPIVEEEEVPSITIVEAAPPPPLPPHLLLPPLPLPPTSFFLRSSRDLTSPRAAGDTTQEVPENSKPLFCFIFFHVNISFSKLYPPAKSLFSTSVGFFNFQQLSTPSIPTVSPSTAYSFLFRLFLLSVFFIRVFLLLFVTPSPVFSLHSHSVNFKNLFSQGLQHRVPSTDAFPSPTPLPPHTSRFLLPHVSFLFFFSYFFSPQFYSRVS